MGGSTFSWVKVAKAHTFCHINPVTAKKKKKKKHLVQQLEERRDTHHRVDASQHLWHIMKAAWQKCSLSFSKRDFLEIPCGMYWPSSTLRDRGSGMKSLSHNQSLQGAEHMNNKWLKTACPPPQQTQWYHRGIQTDITDELTPCAAAWLKQSRGIVEGGWLKFEVSTVRFRWRSNLGHEWAKTLQHELIRERSELMS